MGDTYTLTLNNQSTDPDWTFAVYTATNITDSSHQLPVAWLTKKLNSGNTVVFEWTLSYKLTFADQGVQQDVKWTESGSVDADDNAANNAALLDYPNSDYSFTSNPGVHPVKPGYLYIDTTGDVPSYNPDNGPSVGLAISGGEQSKPAKFNPAIAGVSGPSLHHDFELHPTYYVVAGDKEEGTMVDLSTQTNQAKVEYEPGEFSQEWTLNDRNVWVRDK
ncbi:hypothetical protein [Kitasatospora purpeofusca]|uniref:hypothetical protein n=1 Tax=Kitasatospora purpeofusca TaxID=67352 RepID=UPI002A5A2B10|nr:hypothetical protein [Kitasatospora purpeofusca]MDY0810786.1 hypothetical protein [Kitasatospora purpeofusca]